jgi:8-oxo-dGTP diphosphatase
MAAWSDGADSARVGRCPVGGRCFCPRVHTVVLGALTREHEVLLVHRRPDKHAYPNVWDLPGGLVEPGESELGALARELHEELGVHVFTDSAAHLCRVTVAAGEDQATLSSWLVHDWRGTPSNAAPHEHDDINWFRVEDLPPPPHPVMRTALLNALLGQRDQRHRLAAAHSAVSVPAPAWCFTRHRWADLLW